MLVLLASLAQADTVDLSPRSSLLDAATQCCLAVFPPEEATTLHDQPEVDGQFLRTFAGFTRVGNRAAIGGNPMREQAIMLDGTNLLLEGREGPFMQRTGSPIAHPTATLPRPSVQLR